MPSHLHAIYSVLSHLSSAFKCDAHVELRKEQCPARLRHSDTLALITLALIRMLLMRMLLIRMLLMRMLQLPRIPIQEEYTYVYVLIFGKKSVWMFMCVCIGVCIYV